MELRDAIKRRFSKSIKESITQSDVKDALKYSNPDDIIIIHDIDGKYYEIKDILPSPDDGYVFIEIAPKYDFNEDTIKKSNGKWTNKGKDGEHGEFDTKKQADAQRKAMFANGYKG